jgi:hypothetical protein
LLRLGVAVYLTPGRPLPKTPQEAVRTVGRGYAGGWYLSAEGGDLIAEPDYRYHSPSATPVSMLTLSAGFPDFAAWQLTAPQQEAALLRHIARWKHKTTGQAQSDDTTVEYIKLGADLVSDFVPGVSNVKDFVTFLTGVNPVTGEKVGWLGRLLALVFAIPGLGTLLKWLGKGGRAIGKFVLGPMIRMAMNAGGKLVKWVAKSRWGGKVIKWAGWAWRGLKKQVRKLVGPKILKGAEAANARAAFTASEKQLQKKYQKHAADFGVVGNWNPAKAKDFEAALASHVHNPSNLVIKGSYNAAPAIIHVDPKTGLAVIQDLNGAFVSGWRLSSQQLSNVLAHGSLGGH